MTHDRCRGVFPRDRITATTLQRWSIPVFDCGNPMMDDLEPKGHLPELPLGCKVLLLPGSHAPEVLANWRLMISAIASLPQNSQKYVFLGAIAPGIDLYLSARHTRGAGVDCERSLWGSLSKAAAFLMADCQCV